MVVCLPKQLIYLGEQQLRYSVSFLFKNATYSHERSHIYILLLLSLNLVQTFTTITNSFIHIILVVICIMQTYQPTLPYIKIYEYLRNVR